MLSFSPVSSVLKLDSLKIVFFGSEPRYFSFWLVKKKLVLSASFDFRKY